MIRIIPLTEDEYDAFYDYNIQDYVEAMVRAGNARPGLAVKSRISKPRAC